MAARILVLAFVALALTAAQASAATICVPNAHAGDCGPTAVSLQGAIDIAALNTTRDTIRIASGQLAAENALVSAGNVVDIVGAGRGPGGTVLARGTASDFALDVQSPASTVSHLRVLVPGQPAPTDYESGIALSAEDVVAREITVVGAAGMSLGSGILMRPGTVLRNSTVEVPIAGTNNAVSAAEDTLLEDVALAGATMINARDSGPPVVVRRLRSSQPSGAGIDALGGAGVDVSDALIRLSGGPDSFALGASTFGGEDSTITARQVTVIGSGDPTEGGIGVYAAGDSSTPRTATVDVRDSVFHSLTTHLDAETFFAAPTARIAIDHSNVALASRIETGPGTEQIAPGASNLFVDPGFVSPAALDFHLRADSQLVDRGFPGAGSAADLDGQPRPNDGNGDGVAVRDLGAFELQRPLTPAPDPGDTAAPLFSILSRTLTLDRRGRVAVVLRGPTNETASSGGSLSLRTVKRLRVGAAAKRRVVLGRKRFSLRPAVRSIVRMKLSRKNARRVRVRRRVRVTLAVTVRDAAGNARTARKRVTLRVQPKRR